MKKKKAAVQRKRLKDLVITGDRQTAGVFLYSKQRRSTEKLMQEDVTYDRHSFGNVWKMEFVFEEVILRAC